MNTNRDEHPEIVQRLSDYIAGELSPGDFGKVEDHLSECGDCRRVLEDLRAVVAEAAALGPIDPPRDLWGGIAATIQAPAPVTTTDTKVIAFPTGRGAAQAPTRAREEEELLSGTTRRYAFSTPQLVAASVALIAASSLATWSAGPGLAGSGPAAADVASPPGVATMTSDAAPPPADLAEEIATLERTLTEAREVLEPNTVRVLERNLAVIERAIEDSRLALQQDPGNEFLAAHLERGYERKLTFLREAARVAEWSD